MSRDSESKTRRKNSWFCTRREKTEIFGRRNNENWPFDKGFPGEIKCRGSGTQHVRTDQDRGTHDDVRYRSTRCDQSFILNDFYRSKLQKSISERIKGPEKEQGEKWEGLGGIGRYGLLCSFSQLTWSMWFRFRSLRFPILRWLTLHSFRSCSRRAWLFFQW